MVKGIPDKEFNKLLKQTASYMVCSETHLENESILALTKIINEVISANGGWGKVGVDYHNEEKLYEWLVENHYDELRKRFGIWLERQGAIHKLLIPATPDTSATEEQPVSAKADATTSVTPPLETKKKKTDYLPPKCGHKEIWEFHGIGERRFYEIKEEAGVEDFPEKIDNIGRKKLYDRRAILLFFRRYYKPGKDKRLYPSDQKAVDNLIIEMDERQAQRGAL